MNREIIFRGKRVDNGEWAQGFYFSYAVDVYSCGEIIGAKDEHYIITPCHEDFNYENTYEINKETIGQFTGLCDSKGNKLFEGDLMKLTSTDTDGSLMKQIDEIKWSKYGWICGKDLQCLADYLCFDPSYENLELFGNIHEVNEC